MNLRVAGSSRVGARLASRMARLIGARGSQCQLASAAGRANDGLITE